MKRLNLLLIFYCCCISLSAQKFGDISKEMLEQVYHPKDSSASAAYLLDEVEIRYEFSTGNKILMILDYHSIIKVYDQDGEEYGTKEIYLYEKGGKREKVSKIKAITANLVNGKVVKTKLDKNDIFEERYSKNYTKKVFAMPEVKAGSVIEIKYSLVTPYLYTIPKWYFQDYIPTDVSSYTIKVPKYFVLTPVPSGFHPLEVNEEKISISNHGEVKFNYIAREVPAIEEDDYVLDEDDYRSGIKYEISRTRFPGQSEEKYSQDWDEIVDQLRKSDKFGKQLKKSYNDLEPIIAEAKGYEGKERITYLYDYVRKNYIWNYGYGVRSNETLKKIIETKSGNATGLNLLLLYLLEKSDIVAYPLVMKTRYSGLLNTHYPSLSELNYMIVYIEDGDGYLLLDASSRLTPLGELPPRAINYYAVLVRDNSSEVLQLTNPNIYKIQTVSKYEYDADINALIGTSQRKRSGYAATKYRLDAEENENEEKDTENDENESTDEEEDNQEEDIENFNIENTYEVSSIKNLNDIYAPINLEYTEQLNTCTKKIGNKVFIDAALDFGMKENPFSDYAREYPIFFKNTINSRVVASIKLPEGYAVEAIPDAVKVALPDRAGTFTYEVKMQGNDLLINYFYSIKDTIVLPQNYPALRQFYDIIFQLAKEKIVLTKA